MARRRLVICGVFLLMEILLLGDEEFPGYSISGGNFCCSGGRRGEEVKLC